MVIVTGAPPVFSAGADAPHARRRPTEERRQIFLSRKSQFRRLFERANTMLEDLEQATICAINGHAVGGGWGLTLACDFRFAAASAQLWIPEVDLGVPLGVASTTRFVRMVGPARAKEIIMELPALLGGRGRGARARAPGRAGRSPGRGRRGVRRRCWRAKPFRALAEMKARINAIARTGIPEVNAMTEGFLDRD